MPRFSTPFTKKQLETLELLTKHSIKETAKVLGKKYEWKNPEQNVNQILYTIRNKTEKYRLGVNIITNYMKHKRLGKLLRRQEAV